MKKISKSLLALLLAAILSLSFTACSKKAEVPEQSDINASEQTQAAEQNGIEKTGLWKDAVYLTDTELGHGSKNVVVEVKSDDQSVKFTIHTDKLTVGDALLESNLIAGDESEYGLYVKTVNGITADYDVDQSYWAFYIDGEYASTGVDSTDISESSVYQLVYTK